MEKLINILKRICVLNRDNGTVFTNTERLDEIAALLRESPYKRIETDGLFHLYGTKPPGEINGPVLVVSSHVDCERHITRCFFSHEADGLLLGTFDNAITNAAILYLMLSGRIPENVLIAFTGDEESGSRGAADLVRFIRKSQLKLLHIFVLDVTGEGWENRADFTIENDFWDQSFGARIIQLVQEAGYRWNFVPENPANIPDFVPKEAVIPMEAYADESWEYDEAGIPCFSFCLPTKGEMHSDAGILARTHSLERYTEALCLLLNKSSGFDYKETDFIEMDPI